MTRAELIGVARASMPERRRRAEVDAAIAVVDVVLDEVLRIAVPRLQNDYGGSEVLQELYRLRGGRP